MIALLLASALAAPALPERTLTSLANEPVVLPTDLTEPAAVIVSFSRKHSDGVDAWREALIDTSPWSLAVVGELGRTTRWIVTTAMKGSYDSATEARTALVLEEPTALVEALELADDSELAVIVVEPSGVVVWSHTGEPTDAAIAEAKAALAAL